MWRPSARSGARVVHAMRMQRNTLWRRAGRPRERPPRDVDPRSQATERQLDRVWKRKIGAENEWLVARPENLTRSYLLGRPLLYGSAMIGATWATAYLIDGGSGNVMTDFFREQVARRDAIMKLRDPFVQNDTLERIQLWLRANFTDAHRTLMAITAVNGGIFLLWRIPALSNFMQRNFMHAPMGGRLLTMWTANFSHMSVAHFAFNHIALWSFATGLYYELGHVQFLAVCATACMTSSMATQIVSVLRRSAIPGLGASGVVMALMGITAALKPDAEFAIIFLPFITFSAMAGLQAIIAFDVVGLALGWSSLGHAAHLGGCLFGVWYAYHGRDVIWGQRQRILNALGLAH